MNKASEILQQVKKIVVGNEDNIAKIMMAICYIMRHFQFMMLDLI